MPNNFNSNQYKANFRHKYLNSEQYQFNSIAFCNFLNISDNILSCNEPNDKSMFGGVRTLLKTRTLPGGMMGHQLSFHYICGKYF